MVGMEEREGGREEDDEEEEAVRHEERRHVRFDSSKVVDPWKTKVVSCAKTCQLSAFGDRHFKITAPQHH